MMPKLAIPEESRQHGQGACRESLIDEWFLTFEGLDSRTTGQRVFAGGNFGNFWIELADCPQPFGLAAVSAVERLAQNKLPARCIVPEIEPVRDVARFPGYASLDDSPRRPCVHTRDQEIRTPVIVRPKRRIVKNHGLGIPFRSPEQVDAVDEDGRLVLAHIGSGERLPNAVGFGNRVTIHERDFEAVNVTPGPHGLWR
jgi:hypothetical protein